MKTTHVNKLRLRGANRRRIIPFLLVLLMIPVLFSACRRDPGAQTGIPSRGEHVHAFSRWTAARNGHDHTRMCDCGKKESESHTFDTGVVTKKATCTEDGVKTYACTKCADKRTEPIPSDSSAHNFSSWTAEPNEKTHVRTCACGKTESDVHTYGAGNVTKAATCTEEGVKTFACTGCGTKRTETIPKNGSHSYDAGVVTKAATCITDGVKTFTCTGCGTKKTEAVPAAGTHTYDTGVVTKNASCTVQGEKTFTCTLCGSQKAETIPKNDAHSFGKWIADGDGKSHARTCACGKKESEAHSFDTGKVTKEPTVSSTGRRVYTCTKCSTTQTETLPQIEHTHSYGGWTDDCNGSTHSRSCFCGDTETAAHSFDTGTVTTEPTCDSEGIMTYICYGCGAVQTEWISKTDPPDVPNTPDDPKYPDYIEYDHQKACWKCGHDDGTVPFILYAGVETDASWTCSSCGTYNQHTLTYEASY